MKKISHSGLKILGWKYILDENYVDACHQVVKISNVGTR